MGRSSRRCMLGVSSREKNKVNQLYLSGTPRLGLDLAGRQDMSRQGSAGHDGLCKRKLRLN